MAKIVVGVGVLTAAHALGCANYVEELYDPLTDPKLATGGTGGSGGTGGMGPECGGGAECVGGCGIRRSVEYIGGGCEIRCSACDRAFSFASAKQEGFPAIRWDSCAATA
jgi:hypothetical protein